MLPLPNGVGKFYGAVNTVISRLGGVCYSDKVWMTIVEKQMFPVLAYSNHLWNYDNSSVVKKINAAYRRGIRKGLGMAQKESLLVCQHLSRWFEEASVELKRDQLQFLKRAMQSQNTLLCLGFYTEIEWLVVE